jgi:hypothetical protein
VDYSDSEEEETEKASLVSTDNNSASSQSVHIEYTISPTIPPRPSRSRSPVSSRRSSRTSSNDNPFHHGLFNGVSPTTDAFENLRLHDQTDEHAFFLYKTQKGGYKLYSNGFCYTVDKPSQKVLESGIFTKVNWKCEFATCGGKGGTTKLDPPFRTTKPHGGHVPEFDRLESIKTALREQQGAHETNDAPRHVVAAARAQMSEGAQFVHRSAAASKRYIRRQRDKKYKNTNKAQCLSEITVPDDLRKTLRGDAFYLADSGAQDKNRVIMFATEDNLLLLNDNPDWFGDGTFDIAPTHFKQLYTIHVLKRK